MLPHAKYCRIGRIAHVLLENAKIYDMVCDYLLGIFKEDDLTGLTSTHSASSIFYAALMAMEGIVKEYQNLKLPATYGRVRKTIADVIQKFRENKSVRYTETQRAEVIAALDQLLNNAKKNVSLDTSLRDSFAKKYTSGVCVSAPPYEYGALTNQKSHEEWSSLANHLLRTSTVNVMDEEIKMTEYEKKSGLTVHEDVDQMSVQDILSMFRMLPSLGDRGVVPKDLAAPAMYGFVSLYSSAAPIIINA